MRRCLGTLSWRVVCGSLRSTRAISGRGMSLNPRPESMPSAGVNHGGRLATGNWETPTVERQKLACGRGASGVRQGRLRRAAGLKENEGRGGGVSFYGDRGQLNGPL